MGLKADRLVALSDLRNKLVSNPSNSPSNNSTSDELVEVFVDIKIGIKETPRELVIVSEQTAEEVEQVFAEASQDAARLFKIKDEKGRRFLIPIDQIAYLEIVPSEIRKVGFSVGV